MCPYIPTLEPLYALIDFGASDSFMNSDFAFEHNLSPRLKPRPLKVETINGSEIASGPITHDVVLNSFSVGPHSERLIVDLACIPHYPLILGTPWLTKHNPSIDWSKRSFNFPQKIVPENASQNQIIFHPV